MCAGTPLPGPGKTGVPLHLQASGLRAGPKGRPDAQQRQQSDRSAGILSDETDRRAVQFRALSTAVPKQVQYAQGTAQRPRATAPARFPGAGPRDTRPVKLEEVDNLKAITVVLNVFPFELPTSYDAAEKLLAEHYNGNPMSYYNAEKDYRDFFFYRAIVGINRAVSELATHPKYNGKMVYWGSSQGGAMGVALTALNKNIDAMVVNVPSDFRKLFLRAEYASGDSGYLCYADYFSAENFARRITVPVLVSAGLIDFTCPPTTISRWFNILPSKDKKIVYIPGMGHDFDDNYQQLTAEFIAEHLEI